MNVSYWSGELFTLSFVSSGPSPAAVTGWMLYAVSAEGYVAGAFSGSASGMGWQTLSTANSACVLAGLTDTYPQPSSYALPLSLQYAAPSNAAGLVSIYAVVILQATFYSLLPPLTLYPVQPPVATAPVDAPGSCVGQVGGGVVTLVCTWTASMNDGGALITSMTAACFSSPQSVTPVASVSAQTSPLSYPVSATLSFTSPPLSVGQTYIFSITANNSLGASPALLQPITNSQQTQSNTLPVSGSSASISAGGVFGIVVGSLAFIGLLYLAARFYQRKGHFRDSVLHMPMDTEHAIDEGETAGQAAAGGRLQQEEEEEEEEVGEEEEGEEDLELGGDDGRQDEEEEVDEGGNEVEEDEAETEQGAQPPHPVQAAAVQPSR